jgi:hypothetical protein
MSGRQCSNQICGLSFSWYNGRQTSGITLAFIKFGVSLAIRSLSDVSFPMRTFIRFTHILQRPTKSSDLGILYKGGYNFGLHYIRIIYEL